MATSTRASRPPARRARSYPLVRGEGVMGSGWRSGTPGGAVSQRLDDGRPCRTGRGGTLRRRRRPWRLGSKRHEDVRVLLGQQGDRLVRDAEHEGPVAGTDDGDARTPAYGLAEQHLDLGRATTAPATTAGAALEETRSDADQHEHDAEGDGEAEEEGEDGDVHGWAAVLDGPVLLVADDVGDADAELLVDHDDLAAGDEGAVHEHVDGAADRAIELDHRPGAQLEDVTPEHAGPAELSGDAHDRKSTR